MSKRLRLGQERRCDGVRNARFCPLKQRIAASTRHHLLRPNYGNQLADFKALGMPSRQARSNFSVRKRGDSSLSDRAAQHYYHLLLCIAVAATDRDRSRPSAVQANLAGCTALHKHDCRRRLNKCNRPRPLLHRRRRARQGPRRRREPRWGRVQRRPEHGPNIIKLARRRRAAEYRTLCP